MPACISAVFILHNQAGAALSVMHFLTHHFVKLNSRHYTLQCRIELNIMQCCFYSYCVWWFVIKWKSQTFDNHTDNLLSTLSQKEVNQLFIRFHFAFYHNLIIKLQKVGKVKVNEHFSAKYTVNAKCWVRWRTKWSLKTKQNRS